MVPVPSLIRNDVFMTSLLLLKIINVLALFLISIRYILVFFGFIYGYFIGRRKDKIWFLAIKFNNGSS